MPRGVPPPAPPYTARWEINGKIDDITPWQVGFHLLVSTETLGDASTVRRFHEDLLTISEIAMPGLMANGTTTSLSRLLLTLPATQVSDILFLTAQGARGPGVPSALSVCVDQLVQARGRGRQGRFFLPPPAESDVQFGVQLTPGAKSSYSSILAAFFNEVNGLTSSGVPTCRFGVISRQRNGAWLPGAIPQPVDTWRLTSRLSTQVRRLRHTRFP